MNNPRLNRRIRNVKSESLSIAVWNPWAETAAQMDDLGGNGWRDMVCVERDNAIENSVTLAQWVSKPYCVGHLFSK